MKKILITTIVFISSCRCYQAKAQTDEAIQLILNVEKLSQLKQILSDMKTGYDILSKGYNTVKGLSQGNFSLHQAFLDGLWAVSPTVRQYGRITDIVNNQVLIVKEYKAAFDRFKNSGSFSIDEIDYMGSVYDRLFNQSLHNLDELADVITANKLRMADDERIKAIDRIDADMGDKLQFLRSFNRSTSVLALQRAKQKSDNAAIKKMYGIN
jgi:hypothetical protein